MLRRTLPFLALILFAPTAALAQTTDIVEKKTDSGYAVWFPIDKLGADSSIPSASIIKVGLRGFRLPLMRPRLQFVPEMLKSVEAL